MIGFKNLPALTTDLNMFGKELFAECKQALHMKINLPVIPRVRRAFTDEEVEEYYVDLFRRVFEKAASALLRRYQSQPLEIANFYVVFWKMNVCQVTA